MQELEAGKEPRDGTPRLRLVQPGDELDVLLKDSHMPKVQPEQTTVLVIELKHVGDLPTDYQQTASLRAHDYLAGKGVMMKDARPIYLNLSALPVRESINGETK